MSKVRISGVGCCLMDRIYDGVDFTSDLFRKYLSKKAGDGGLEPGKLTFEEELERFSGDSFATEILPQLTQGRKADKENIGGPAHPRRPRYDAAQGQGPLQTQTLLSYTEIGWHI